MKKLLLLLLITTVYLSVSSCKKDLPGNSAVQETEDKAAPDGFDYSTTKKVEVNVRLLTRTEQPVKGVLVSIYSPASLTEGTELARVLSDDNGYVKTSVVIPAGLDSLIIDPAYIGLMRNAKAYVTGNSLSAIIGGKTGYSGNIVAENVNRTGVAKTFSARSSAIPTVYNYKASDFDSNGRPVNRSAVDNIDFSALMTQITATLPERKAVDPKYIKTEAPANLNITDLADVWITFLHEGANYKNVLGYYTYPTGHAPQSAAEIDSVHIIFMNASLNGSGGGMLTGDKVKIGRFTPGTTIGFVLLQDAYNNGSVNTGGVKFFTNESLNPEANNNKKRHNVLLHGASQRIFMIGFEDIDRSTGKNSDNDFNDLLFYAQSNPVEAISPKDIPYLDEKVKDTDEDGVPDTMDEYPEDPERAYVRYYPSKDVWGTTAFEDQWPAEGDYDLNDLVVSYRYKFAMSTNNRVVDLTGEYKPLAAGASFQNGFGVQLPLNPSVIKSVTGQAHINNYIKLAGNGVEGGQSKAVIIPFDNYRALFGSSASYINTSLSQSKINSNTVTVYLELNSTLADDFTAEAPFNPFMISNLTRGREIHLVNHKPTDLVNMSLLNTSADNSNQAANRYYITADNRPFALDYFGFFAYPTEKNAIYDAYLHFAEWAKSGGKLYSDWYLDKPGYRKAEYIYTK